MAAAVLPVGRGLDALGAHVAVQLVVQILLGAVVYTSAAFILAHESVIDLLQLVRKALRRT